MLYGEWCGSSRAVKMTDQTYTREVQMPTSMSNQSASEKKAYIVTGPTSGIGRRTAMDLAGHGTVVLVKSDRLKLHALQQKIQQKGGSAALFVCDLSDVQACIERWMRLSLQATHRRAGQQRRHHADAPYEEHPAAGICPMLRTTLGPSY